MIQRVYVDMDGVLADFDSAFAYAARERGWLFNQQSKEWGLRDKLFRPNLGKDSDKIRQSVVQDIVCTPGFWLHIPVMHGARAAMVILQRRYKEVFIATTPWWSSPNCKAEKLEYMKLNFGVDEKRVHMLDDKGSLEGDLIIDDKVEHIVAWRGPEAIVFAQPWNERICDHTAVDTHWVRLPSWIKIVSYLLYEIDEGRGKHARGGC